MPPTFIMIEDIAVTCLVDTGEANINPHGLKSQSELTDEKRKTTIDRLEKLILKLMDRAHTTYKNKHKNNLNYITRLSTNEFLFYTEKPLTLKEFEDLQNRIYKKAKKLPSGVQLILGSFAVQTEDNLIANVTAHITCGSSPAVHFIVKNSCSDTDVRYKTPGGPALLPLTNKVHTCDYNAGAKSVDASYAMPKIRVNGIDRRFTFDNIIHSKTPGGIAFITAVDICLDHFKGVAKANYEARPDIHELPISHVVVSKTIKLNPEQCLGKSVMHVDPEHSWTIGCKKDIGQTKEDIFQSDKETEANLFGPDCLTIFEVNPAPIYPLTIKNTYKDRQRWHWYPAVLFKEEYQSIKGDALKAKILDNFKNAIEKTKSSDELVLVKEEILKSEEFQVLITGQGLYTRLRALIQSARFSRLETPSEKALHDMIEQKETFFKLQKSNTP